MPKSAADEVIATLEATLEASEEKQRRRLLGRWIVQGGVVVRDVTFEDLETNPTLPKGYRFLFRRPVAELDYWVREERYWRGPAHSLDVSVVRGGNLPAAVQSIVPGGGGRGARDVGQLSDRELRVELAVSSAWVSYLRIMNDPESRRERQLQRAEVLGYLTYREHFRWWSEDLREQFFRTLRDADRRLFSSGDRAAAADP